MKMGWRRLVICFVCLAVLAVGIWYSRIWRSPITSWDCPRMQALEEQWNAVYEVPCKTKDEHYEMVKDLKSLLNWNLSLRDVRNLTDTRDSVPAAYEARSDFETAILKHLICVLADAGERARLVELLSTHCPNSVNPYVCIEFHLALHSDTLKDPMLILGEAYAMSTDDNIRHTIAVAVRRGFAESGIADDSDDAVVKKAMAWYRTNRDNVVVNSYYHDNAGAFPPEAYDGEPFFDDKMLHRQPLFVEKP